MNHIKEIVDAYHEWAECENAPDFDAVSDQLGNLCDAIQEAEKSLSQAPAAEEGTPAMRVYVERLATDLDGYGTLPAEKQIARIVVKRLRAILALSARPSHPEWGPLCVCGDHRICHRAGENGQHCTAVHPGVRQLPNGAPEPMLCECTEFRALEIEGPPMPSGADLAKLDALAAEAVAEHHASRSSREPSGEPTELDAVLREAKRISEEHGCTNKGCFIDPPRGAHTNGVCQCARRPVVAGRLILLYMAVRNLMHARAPLSASETAKEPTQ